MAEAVGLLPSWRVAAEAAAEEALHVLPARGKAAAEEAVGAVHRAVDVSRRREDWAEAWRKEEAVVVAAVAPATCAASAHLEAGVVAAGVHRSEACDSVEEWAVAVAVEAEVDGRAVLAVSPVDVS